jgi:hypothetical protein
MLDLAEGHGIGFDSGSPGGTIRCANQAFQAGLLSLE